MAALRSLAGLLSLLSLAALAAPAQAEAQPPAVLLRDIRPGGLGSGILGFTEMQGRLYFSAQTATQFDLFATDGTPAGTVPFGLPNNGVRVHNSVPVGVDTNVFFLASTVANGQELWKTDGTVAGTHLVADLNPGPTDAFADLLTPWRGYCWFTAVVPLGLNYGLWRSDGTAAGTVRVGLWSAALRRMAVAGGKLFLVAVDPAFGDELWVLDDPTGTPRMVLDIRPGPQGASVDGLVEWRDKLWFSANDGVNGNELWCSDGTAAGTMMVADVTPGPGSTRPAVLTPTRDWLYFIPADVGSSPILMQCNGTLNGTQPVPHNPPLIGFAGPIGITTLGDVVYARAATQPLSPIVDLWRIDGTANGTTRVRGADPNRHLVPQDLLGTGSRYVYFQGDDGINGIELWRSDGTASGTTLVADLVPGPAGSAPYLLRSIGANLVFLANTPATGVEPFAVPLDAHGQPIGAPCGAPARATALTATDPVLGQTCSLSGRNAQAGSIGFLFVSLPAASPLQLPVGAPSCRLLLSPASMLPLTRVAVSGSTWSLALPIPNNLALHRVLLRAQGVFAPTNGAGGLDVTNAANLLLGL
jgi:ELWxxDGT repeat protein